MTQAKGPNAYALDLPASLSKLHSVFTVSKLKSYQGLIPPVPKLIELDDLFEYAVEAILHHQFVGCSCKYLQYLAAFISYSLLYDEWFPAHNLFNAPDLLCTYQA